MTKITKNYKRLEGQQFGRLTALYRLHNTKGRTKWLCVCECGNLVEVKENNLLQGGSKSCGCSRKHINIKHGKTNTRLFITWQNIKNRCYNNCNNEYKNYGARGIAVCNEWVHDFMAFYNWAMNNGYDDNLTIDRINENGNYEPNNCRWVTMKQQQRNKRSNHTITINGETHCLSEWCDILGLNYSTVKSRIQRNWSIEKALEV